jgi:hypothetical protein
MDERQANSEAKRDDEHHAYHSKQHHFPQPQGAMPRIAPTQGYQDENKEQDQRQ